MGYQGNYPPSTPLNPTQLGTGVVTTDAIANGAVVPADLSTGAPSWDTSGNATVSGNLTLSGTAKRITGDFSNATIANRVMFQTSTVNGATRVEAIPNGTGTTCNLAAYNNSDPTNASAARLTATSADARVESIITGTGTYLPLTLYTNGSERMRIDSSGNVGIGTASPVAGYRLNVVNDSGNSQQLIRAGTNYNSTIAFGDQDSSTSGQLIYAHNGDYMAFNTNASERMRITANGGVAFGGASNYGTSGQVLTSNGDAAPTWGTVSGTPSGSVVAFAGSSAPSGWLLCSGAAVSRTTYAALFAVIGTTYGAGDGSTTFNLPDMRGRSAFGVDNMGGTAANRITSGGSGITGTTLGAAGGAETVTLTSSQMPSHTHDVLFSPVAGNTTWATTYYLARSVSGGASFAVGNLGGGSALNTVTNQNTGSGGAHNNTPPAIILNYIIKT